MFKCFLELARFGESKCGERDQVDRKSLAQVRQLYSAARESTRKDLQKVIAVMN